MKIIFVQKSADRKYWPGSRFFPWNGSNNIWAASPTIISYNVPVVGYGPLKFEKWEVTLQPWCQILQHCIVLWYMYAYSSSKVLSNEAKTKYILSKNFRVGRSGKDFIFYFIFILFLVDTLSNIRPKKKIYVFPITCLKILGSVGRLFFYFLFFF